MLKQLPRLSALLLALALPACAGNGPDSSSSTGAIIEVDCAEGPECPAGFECEVEEEHGVVTSFCQADEGTDPGCPDGYEQEIEHGQVFCQPHDGDDDGTAGNDDPAGDDDGTAGNDDPAGDDNGAGSDDPAGDDNGGGGTDDTLPHA